MSRFMLAWELGGNLGHLSRLLPLARGLAQRGHEVRLLVREVPTRLPDWAPGLLRRAPRIALHPVTRGDTRMVSYADLLWRSGWADPCQLEKAVRAWIEEIEAYQPDLLIVDHSPTALLARSVVGRRCVMLGTGFEMPPLTDPLPVFPGYAGLTAERARAAERRVLDAANMALFGLGARPLAALRELFSPIRRWFSSLAELDQYGARKGERYVGPVGTMEDGKPVSWPQGAEQKIFAYLRADTPHLQAILQALVERDCAVVCYAPGVLPRFLSGTDRPGFHVFAEPVNIESVVREATLCISYGPAGTVTETLLHGIPQLVSPVHVEAQLTAQRVEHMGAGLTLRGMQDSGSVGVALGRLLDRFDFRARALSFAERYRSIRRENVLGTLIKESEALACQ